MSSYQHTNLNDHMQVCVCSCHLDIDKQRERLNSCIQASGEEIMIFKPLQHFAPTLICNVLCAFDFEKLKFVKRDTMRTAPKQHTVILSVLQSS